MDNYDSKMRNGIHTVEITLQHDCYFGHITTEISGNTKGLDIICFFSFIDEVEHNQNDCDLTYDEDNEEYCAMLTAKDGSKLQVVGSVSYFNNMIVKVEITDFRKITG